MKEHPHYEWMHPQATSKGTEFLKVFMQDYVAHWVSHDKMLPVLLDLISTAETDDTF